MSNRLDLLFLGVNTKLAADGKYPSLFSIGHKPKNLIMNYFNLHAMVRMSAILFFSIVLSWNPLYADAACPDCILISKRNWYNSMGHYEPGAPCVALTADNDLIFSVKVRYMDDDLSPYPSSKIYYNIPEVGMEGYSGIINSSDLQPVFFENGLAGFEFSFSVIIDLTSLCNIEPIFPFLVEHQLVNANGGDYNVGAYPTLWPPTIFIIPPSGYTELDSGEKTICCYGTPMTPLIVNDQDGMVAQDVEQLATNDKPILKTGDGNSDENARTLDKVAVAAFPNPFRSELNVQYISDGFGQARITCYDSQGKIMEHINKSHASQGFYKMNINTNNWPSGIYYIQIANADNTQTIKVLKSDK